MSEIQVDKQILEETGNHFAATSVTLHAACVAAKSAEYVGHHSDVKPIDNNNNRVCKKVDDLTGILVTITNSFSATDEKLKKEAEKFVGPQYNNINNGYTLVGDKDGNIIKVGIGFTPPEGSFSPHQQNLNLHPGNCTNSCLAMMIQRYYLKYKGSCDFVYDDIHPNAFYWAVEDFGKNKSDTLPDGLTYYAKGGGPLQGNLQGALAHELTLHPEGVLIYGPYADGGQHAILITGCTPHSDGTFSFTAIDPANATEGDLLNSTLFSGGSNHSSYSSVDEMLSNLFFFQYIDSVK